MINETSQGVVTVDAPPVPDLSAVSIVVLSYNRREDIERNLRSLLAVMPAARFELIVVDNASSDGSAQVIRTLIGEAARQGMSCIFVESATNLGAAGGRNLGWARAGREFILSIDDDTHISVEPVAAMVDLLRASPTVGGVFPRIRTERSGVLATNLGESVVQVSGFHEACFMIRRAVFERIGGIDEALFFGGEGFDYGIRTRSLGMQVVHLPAVEVVHNQLPRDPAASRRRRERWLAGFCMVHHKHFPLSVALGFTARYALASMVSGVRDCGLAIVPGLGRAAVSGILAGRRRRTPAPAEVVVFYRDPKLRPEFGNEPLTHKLRRRFAGWRGKAG